MYRVHTRGRQDAAHTRNIYEVILLNGFSIILTLAGLFVGLDRYALHLPAMAAFDFQLYIPTALSLLGMLLGFIGMPGKKKKERRTALRCATFGLIVCLILTALWLYQVLTGEAVSFDF